VSTSINSVFGKSDPEALRVLADELLAAAQSFRDHPLYTKDGDPIRLVRTARRLDAAAAVLRAMALG
jgi:hypothetical protein